MDRALAKAFGRVLRELRESRGVSQEALAFECDLDRTYISMLERGVRQPTISTFFQLAKALGIKPSEVISRLERRR